MHPWVELLVILAKSLLRSAPNHFASLARTPRRPALSQGGPLGDKDIAITGNSWAFASEQHRCHLAILPLLTWDSSSESQFEALPHDARTRPSSCLNASTTIRRAGDDNSLATRRCASARKYEHSRHFHVHVQMLSREAKVILSGFCERRQDIRPEGRRALADRDLVSCQGRSSSEQALRV